MKVYTSSGDEFIIDEDDYEYFKKHTWNIDCYGYAFRTVYFRKEDGSEGRTRIKFHREILSMYGHDIKGKIVDHININPRDNRKENLRYGITYGQSIQNQHRRRDNASGYKGVTYRNAPYRKNWRARIKSRAVL
jgi:hypothetical protein